MPPHPKPNTRNTIIAPGSKVLVTGGAGYIGGAVCHALADAGIQPVVIDDFSRGRRRTVQSFTTYTGDFADPDLLEEAVRRHDVAAVVHCAALTSVPESVREPGRFYRENIAKTIALTERLLALGCRRLVFSSSAAVYHDAAGAGLRESAPRLPTSPYARTKAVIEDLLEDLCRSGGLRAMSLRYFNPIGADRALRWGPAPASGGGTVLDALISAWREDRPFVLMGDDWPTRDGTAVRDFVHAADVARAHVATLLAFDRALGVQRHLVLNVGCGHGTTIRELVAAFNAHTGWQPDVLTGPRRAGDTAGGYGVIDRARRLLRWEPRRRLPDGIRDSIAWREGQRRPAADTVPRPSAAAS